MRRDIVTIFCIFSFLILALPFHAWSSAVAVEPSSRIRSITLYPDRAMVKKEANVSVKKGENIIRFLRITPNLIDQSVQVNIKGDTGIAITDVKVEETYLQKIKQEEAKALQDKLDSLNEQIKKTANEISAIKSAIDFIEKVVPFPQDQKITPAEVEAHAKFLKKSLSERYEGIAKLEIGLNKLQDEKQAVENELGGLNLTRDKTKGIVIHASSSNDNKEATLAFSYIVTNAGWVPQYDVRVDSNASKASVNCFAAIRQSTGEDWKDVDVEISTAKPFIYGSFPELSPWYVDIYDRYDMLDISKSMRSQSMPLTLGAAGEDEEKAFVKPRIVAEATSFSFVLPRKADIRSDNQLHRILIASSSNEALLEYYTAPKLSPYTFLKASFPNPFPFPFLPGNMNVFLDGRFVSASAVRKLVVPDESISLSLGVDEGIKAEKKLVKKFTEYAGAFTKETRVNYEFAIDVVNGKEREIAVTVSDSVPVSRNEKIKVELEAPKKEEAKIGEDGIITWDLKLAKGEKKSLKVKFRVDYPRDVKIIGLE